MRTIAGVFVISALSFGFADRPNGLPARSTAADYPGQGSSDTVTIGAEILDADQAQNSFSTDLSKYVVIEVSVYPKAGQSIDVAALDFALKTEGRSHVRPVSARSIAGVIQKRSDSRKDDILLYPNVGVGRGPGGWGTSTGVGVGVGGGRPGPASTPADRRTMELELSEKGLPEGVTGKAVAGYLYFPADSRRRPASYELEYQGEKQNVTLTLPAPRVK